MLYLTLLATLVAHAASAAIQDPSRPSSSSLNDLLLHPRSTLSDKTLHLTDQASLLKLTNLLPPLGEPFPLPISPDLTAGKAIRITIPRLIDITDNTTDFSTRATTLLKHSVPQALRDFGKDVSLAERGVPLIRDAIVGILSGEGGGLRSRGFFGDLWDWVKDVGCTVFAAGALPAYLLAVADLAYLNPSYIAPRDTAGYKLNEFERDTHWREDILYHMWPIHGDIGTTGPVTLYPSASRPPGFSNALAVTVNRNVYSIYGLASGADPITQPSEAASFRQVVQTMLHELEHVKQYRENGYSLPVFGHRYLFEFCKGGGTAGNVLEQHAYAHNHDMDGDMAVGSQASEFFRVWKFYGYKDRLGFPLDVGFTNPDPSTAQIREKRFQFGVLQLGQKRDGDGARCLRIYTNEEVAKRVNCGVGPCYTDDYEKRGLLWARGPRGVNPPKHPCSPAQREEKKKECQEKNKDWTTLRARQWECDKAVPGYY